MKELPGPSILELVFRKGLHAERSTAQGALTSLAEAQKTRATWPVLIDAINRPRISRMGKTNR